MYKVGVTGGIGSGKSIVCKVFENLGIPVFNADLEARALLNRQVVKDFYYSNFGEAVFSNHEPDRAKIAALAFSNPNALAKINSFIHPLVFEEFNKWCLVQANAPYVIKEAALLIESGGYKILNSTILVTAPVDVRIKRVMQRDSVTSKQVEARILNQWDDDKKMPFVQHSINNSGVNPVLNQIIELHEYFLKQ